MELYLHSLITRTGTDFAYIVVLLLFYVTFVKNVILRYRFCSIKVVGCNFKITCAQAVCIVDLRPIIMLYMGPKFH